MCVFNLCIYCPSYPPPPPSTAHSFPVESMVIRPEDGRVLSHVNANHLLDTNPSTILESLMCVCVSGCVCVLGVSDGKVCDVVQICFL